MAGKSQKVNRSIGQSLFHLRPPISSLLNPANFNFLANREDFSANSALNPLSFDHGFSSFILLLLFFTQGIFPVSIELTNPILYIYAPDIFAQLLMKKLVTAAWPPCLHLCTN